MLIFLIASILFHTSLNSAVAPLLDTLPKSLEVEEQSLLALEDGGADYKGNGTQGTAATSPATAKGGIGHETPRKKPNFLAKWLSPHKYTDYYTLRRLVPKNFADIGYSEEVERNAFYNPAVASKAPLLWIPKDPMGVSRQEVLHTSRVIPITDEGAGFSEKGAVVWNEDERPPIFEEKVYY